jgi:hypothetical protein
MIPVRIPKIKFDVNFATTAVGIDARRQGFLSERSIFPSVKRTTWITSITMIGTGRCLSQLPNQFGMSNLLKTRNGRYLDG